MPGSRIPSLVANHHQQLTSSASSVSFLQRMADKQSPVSPPSTPLLYSPTPLTPSPSSSYPLVTSKSLRPRQTKSTTIARENIQVMVRCRPPSETELKNHEQDCWLMTPDQGSIQLNDPDGIVFEYGKTVSKVFNMWNWLSKSFFLHCRQGFQRDKQWWYLSSWYTKTRQVRQAKRSPLLFVVTFD